MRTHILAASLLALAACGETTTKGAPADGTTQAACNTVEPNADVSAHMRGEDTPFSSLPALPGGEMQGGLYDLASGAQFDGAPSWEDMRQVSVLVTDTDDGATLDWAEQSNGDAATLTRWSARVEATALTFTCGRTGAVPLSYASRPDELQLRMPDPSGTGMLELVFVRRSD